MDQKGFDELESFQLRCFTGGLPRAAHKAGVVAELDAVLDLEVRVTQIASSNTQSSHWLMDPWRASGESPNQ